MSSQRSDKGRDEINLRNLKRQDESIKEILLTASAVTVYKFSIGGKKWDKLPIEGPLHVVRRGNHPRTALIVMNRLDTENLVQPITKETDVKIELPYLMLKNLERGIFCIWFYMKDECKSIATLLMNELASLSSLPSSDGGGGGGQRVDSFVNTMAKLGILNVTVGKSASKGLEPSFHGDGKNLDPSELMSTPSNSVDKQKLENGGRSLNVKDLFAQASLAQGANVSQSSISTDSRLTPRATPRNQFAPINLLYDLERVKTDDSGEPSSVLVPNDSQEDEMLTPAMIKERSNKDKSLIKENDRQPPLGIYPSPDLVPSIDDSFIYGGLQSSQHSNLQDHSRHQSSLTTNRSLNQSNFLYDSQLPIDQLKHVLINLIQTDSEFVAKIRAALIAHQHQSSFQ